MKISSNNINFNGLNLNKTTRKIADSVSLESAGADVFQSMNKGPALKKGGFINYIKSIIFKSQISDAKDAFSRYQHYSDTVNYSLRYEPEFIKEAYERTGDEYFKKMQSFIDKGFDIISRPLASDSKAYRLIFANESFNPKWNIGDIVEEKGFTSASYLPETRFSSLMKNVYNKDDTPINIEILLPKGTKVIKDDGPMKEILIRHGSSFKVVDFDPDTNTYLWQLLG